MTDAEKLRALADWFDLPAHRGEGAEVQDDLRRIATELELCEMLGQHARHRD